jgi:hypothetical protein
MLSNPVLTSVNFGLYGAIAREFNSRYGKDTHEAVLHGAAG